jgi:hypothetical protein
MAFSTPQSNHVYVIIRLKMSENVNGLAGSLNCHYGETDDIFLNGRLVESDDTLMTIAIRHCRNLVGFCLNPTHRLYLAKVNHGLVDHEPVKLYVYVIDVFYKYLR